MVVLAYSTNEPALSYFSPQWLTAGSCVPLVGGPKASHLTLPLGLAAGALQGACHCAARVAARRTSVAPARRCAGRRRCEELAGRHFPRMLRRKPSAPNTIQAAPTAIRIPIGISSHSTIHQTCEYGHSLLPPRAGAVASACFQDPEARVESHSHPYPAPNGQLSRPRIHSVREDVRSRKQPDPGD